MTTGGRGAAAFTRGCRANPPDSALRQSNQPDLKTAGTYGPRSACWRGQLVSVELQEVVSGCNQAPFRANGRPAPSFEAVDPAVRLDLGEDGLDHALAFGVELAADLGGDHPSHEVVGPAESCLSGSVASGVGGDDRDLLRPRSESTALAGQVVAEALRSRSTVSAEAS